MWWTGLVLLLSMSGVGSLGVWQASSKATFYAYAPSAYLVLALDDADARAELIPRIEQGQVSGLVTSRAVEAALDVQGDPSSTWDKSWGRVIEAAHASGQLSESQLERYATQPFELMLSVRETVQRGREPGGYVEAETPSRAGPKTVIEGSVGVKELRIDGAAIPVSSYLQRRASHDTIRSSGGGGSHSHLPLETASQRLGRVPIEADVAGEVTVSIAGKQVGQPIPLSPRTLSAEVEVVDHPTGQYLNTSAFAPAKQAKRAGVWIYQTRSGERLLAVCLIDQPSSRDIPAWLWVQGELIKLNQFTREGGSGGQYQYNAWSLDNLIRHHPKLADAEFGEVIVRGDAEDAETGVRVRPAWLGQWAFREVPLQAKPLPKQPNFYQPGKLPPGSLVPAAARRLTLEEALQPPPKRPPPREPPEPLEPPETP